MTSATSEKQIRARNEQIKRDRITDKIVISSLMSHRDGRRWIWLRLAEGQIFNEGQNLDLAVMAYEKGRRNAALRLLADVTKFCPNEYITMTSENTGVSLEEREDDERSEYTPD